MNHLAIFRGQWVWVLNTHPSSNSHYAVCRRFYFGKLDNVLVAGREELLS